MTGIVDPSNYNLNFHIAVPGGWVRGSSLVLKLYSMVEEEKAKNGARLPLVQARKFLESEIKDSPENGHTSGLGFAILSKNRINVVRWGRKNPFVLKSDIYVFGEMPAEDIKKVGVMPFCLCELGIVDYERNAWIKYFKSARTADDKREYMNFFFKGRL